MSDVYIRTLVFQPTGHVVWGAIDHLPGGVAKKIPQVCPELDFRPYRGPEITRFKNKIINYQLIKPEWSVSSMTVGDLPPEFKSTVQLMRAKCYASAALHRSTRSYLEKRDLVDNYLLDSRLSIEEIGSIYAKHHGVSDANGIKLAQFKINELESLHKSIHKILIEVNLKFETSTDINEIVEIYDQTQVSLGMHNAFDITTML